MLKKQLSVLALIVVSLGNPSHAKLYEPTQKDLNCMATAIYHESRGEDIKGQEMVAKTILNRVSDKKFPSDVCSVVFQKNQFSWSRHTRTAPMNDTYKAVKKVALDVSRTHDPLKAKGCSSATFFTTGRFSFNVRQLCRVGAHNFYGHR